MSLALAVLGVLGAVGSIAAGTDRGAEAPRLWSMAGPGTPMPAQGHLVGGAVLAIGIDQPADESGVTSAARSVSRAAAAINERAPASEVPLVAFVNRRTD